MRHLRAPILRSVAGKPRSVHTQSATAFTGCNPHSVRLLVHLTYALELLVVLHKERQVLVGHIYLLRRGCRKRAKGGAWVRGRERC